MKETYKSPTKMMPSPGHDRRESSILLARIVGALVPFKSNDGPNPILSQDAWYGTTLASSSPKAFSRELFDP